MIKNKFIACCGLDCEKCDARLATVNDDDALRRKTAELWSKLNNAEITPEMINCTGCRTDGVKTPFCSDFCAIRKCALGKGLNTCADCTELQGCGTLAMITADNEQALNNLLRNR